MVAEAGFSVLIAVECAPKLLEPFLVEPRPQTDIESAVQVVNVPPTGSVWAFFACHAAGDVLLKERMVGAANHNEAGPVPVSAPRGAGETENTNVSMSSVSDVFMGAG